MGIVMEADTASTPSLRQALGYTQFYEEVISYFEFSIRGLI